MQAASTAYSGQASDRRFSPVPLTGSSEIGSRTIQAGPGASDGGEPEEGEEGEDGEEEGGEEEGEGGGGGGGGGGGKKTNAGAIAGGVVGGVAVIGLVAVAIIFILRRKKSQAAPAPAAGTPATPATAMHQPPPGWAQSPAGYQGAYPASPEGYKPDGTYYAQPQGQSLVPGQGVDRNSSTSPGGSTVVAGSPTGQGFGYQQFQGPEGQQGGQPRPLHELGS